jgi:ketol-acid reductoisomerase
MRAFYDADANPSLVKAKRVAIIGYGSQGHAHALNLRDSGVDVRIGLRSTSSGRPRAEAEGLTVVDPSAAAKWADIVMLLVPDELAPSIYAEKIHGQLEPGNHLAVAHGFGIHFKKILPPSGVGVFLVAPKAPGHTVRREYAMGRGVPMLIAVDQDPRADSKALALSYAAAIGGGRAGVLETTFREETETDLFGEQAVLCGGLTALIRAGYETLVEAGYAKEMAYFKTFQSQKSIDLIKNRYHNAVNYMDSLFGRFLTHLPRAEEAIVIFTGDHGEEFFEHGHLFHNSHLTREQTHIPLYFKWGLGKRAIAPRGVVSQMDVFPSLLAYLSGEAPPFLEGSSLFHAPQWPYAVTARFNAGLTPYEFCIHNGEYKLIAQFLNRRDLFASNRLRLLSLRTRLDKTVHTFKNDVASWVDEEFGTALTRLFPEAP